MIFDTNVTYVTSVTPMTSAGWVFNDLEILQNRILNNFGTILRFLKSH
jgi:hypothetical protein